MKLTILGAAGVRTPLVLRSIIARQQRIGLSELALMDVDAERLKLMRALCEPLLAAEGVAFKTLWTQDAREAIRGADYVITTFRVGGMESRVIDEQVPLKYGVLGQETTGPGGFAMALRTIPVVLEYVQMVREEAPRAWFLNFTNPAGIVTEAIFKVGGYRRVVGICDNPAAMWRTAALVLNVPPSDLLLEYFGLNHLGWVRAVYHKGVDRLPEIMQYLEAHPDVDLPGLPSLPADFIRLLGLLPNEYNFFYYATQQAVGNLQRAGQSRAQQIMPFNVELYRTLSRMYDQGAAPEEMQAVYVEYLIKRHETYMSLETGHRHKLPELPQQAGEMEDAAEGYSGVALGVIEALQGRTGAIILNVPNEGAITGMAEDDVVEVTCYVGQGAVRPLAMGTIPDHALGLMKRVKAYERLTIQAAVEHSYELALEALSLHPLVPSFEVAQAILEDYREQHGAYFPVLT